MNTLPAHVETLLKRYDTSPVLKALVRLVPFGIGSAADSLVMTQFSNLKADRARAFFDKLASSEISLAPELLDSNEFIHCFTSTMSAALRAHRVEKVEAFAALMNSASRDGSFNNVEDFEDYLKILDELAYREFEVLQLLERYEASTPLGEHDTPVSRANKYWTAFKQEVVSTYGIPEDEFGAFLSRLARTGCYELIVGTYLDYVGGLGYTTPKFRRLKAIVVSAGG
jgi:hypothetical protein